MNSDSYESFTGSHDKFTGTEMALAAHDKPEGPKDVSVAQFSPRAMPKVLSYYCVIIPATGMKFN